MTTNHLHFDIGGTSCGSCVAHVRTALERLPGTRVDSIRVGSADIVTDRGVTERAIRRAIIDAGYELESIRVDRSGDGAFSDPRGPAPP